jgi:hypothetical protein
LLVEGALWEWLEERKISLSKLNFRDFFEHTNKIALNLIFC